MDEYVNTFSKLVDAHNNRKEDAEWIKARLAHLEDCYRWNNI